MKNLKAFAAYTLALVLSVLCYADAAAQRRMRRGVPGEPFEVVVTPYKTTIVADGKDEARIVVTVIDNEGTTLRNVDKKVMLKITGDATFSPTSNLSAAARKAIRDSAAFELAGGQTTIWLQAGKTKGIVKFEAKVDSLYPGSTEIHLVQPGTAHKVTTLTYKPLKVSDKILGADISFLPELESRGMKFYDNGVQKDAIQILKDNGFNYIRLRLFNQPELPEGYSPQKGFCDLAHTLQMAKRIKAAGMKFLLDFHYSDYWADPQQQNKPAAWVGKDFAGLKSSVYDFTKQAMQQLKAQGTVPDMVQVGNEINHGMIWPDGHVNNLDSLAQLFFMGMKAVKDVNPQTVVMLHIALGGQVEESEFFLDNMAKRNVPFDVIGLSYYPKWHGTLTDLQQNMNTLVKRYNKQIMVAEYSHLKMEVNKIAFTTPGSVGSFIWEPLNTWESIFDRDGKSNKYLKMYPVIKKEYGVR